MHASRSTLKRAETLRPGDKNRNGQGGGGRLPNVTGKAVYAGENTVKRKISGNTRAAVEWRSPTIPTSPPPPSHPPPRRCLCRSCASLGRVLISGELLLPLNCSPRYVPRNEDTPWRPPLHAVATAFPSPPTPTAPPTLRKFRDLVTLIRQGFCHPRLFLWIGDIRPLLEHEPSFRMALG